MAIPFAYDEYFIDVVVCVDVSANMAPIFEKTKQTIQSLSSRIINSMEEVGYDVNQLRMKIIAFRDYGSDCDPMTESPFYTFPDQSMEFSSFVDSLEAKGGDGPTNALEAIALALKSDWITGGFRRRHVVFVFTDSPTLPLGARANHPSYPQGMPANLSELEAWWDNQVPGSTYQHRAGRLIAFVPEESPWTNLQAWNRYWSVFFDAGIGLLETDIQQAIEVCFHPDI